MPRLMARRDQVPRLMGAASCGYLGVFNGRSSRVRPHHGACGIGAERHTRGSATDKAAEASGVCFAAGRDVH